MNNQDSAFGDNPSLDLQIVGKQRIIRLDLLKINSSRKNPFVIQNLYHEIRNKVPLSD